MADPNEGKNAATHWMLSRVVDLWMEGKSNTDKTDLMNYLIHHINVWLEWKYKPLLEEYPTRPYPTRPECLKKGSKVDSRIWNVMVNCGYMTLEEMASHSDRELLHEPNFGWKSLKRLRDLVDSTPS